MAITNLYVTPDEIRDWLNVDEKKYDNTFLENLIRMKMDYVDRLSATTWAGNTRQATEVHDLTRPKWGWWIYRLGYPIYLSKLWIKSIDDLKVYSGETWEDWKQLYVEGRDRDYWVVPHEGILFLNAFIIPQAGKEIRITYTYGRDDLPGYVKEITLLLVVRDLLMNERRMFAVPEGAQGVTLSEQIRMIDERIHELEELVRAVHIGRMVYEF